MKNRITRKAMLRSVAVLAVLPIAGMINTAAARAQSKEARTQRAAQTKIAFEVASIKPAVTPGRGPVVCLAPCTPGERLTVEGARVDIRYMSISDLLLRAYRVKPYQVSGPEWINSKRFDIMAKLPEGMAADHLPEMLQTLLADRFQLTIHRETKVQPVYALVVGKNGIKLEPAAPDASTQVPAPASARSMYTPEGDAYFDKRGIRITSGQFGPARSLGAGKWEMSRITMAALADLLTPKEDHPVIDETNLSGAYRFVYEIAVKEGEQEGRGSADDPVRASLLDSIAKGGLKLEHRRAPIETIVIDHVEKIPTAN